MASLETIESLKSSLGLGKFATYSWEQLCELINPDKFYSQIHSGNELRSFMQALSFNYLANNGCTPMPLVFSNDPNVDIAYTTKKDMPNGKSKIVVNKNFETMFNFMAMNKNTYFPYFLFEITLHESVHVWQVEAVYNLLMLNKMPTDLQIAVLDQKLNELKIMAVASGQIGTKGGTDLIASTFMIEKVLNSAKMRAENPLWDYSNSPAEITARDHATTALNQIVETYVRPQLKGLFREYVKDSNHQSFSLLTDPKFNNYDFFEELKYCQLFEDIHEISASYELLSSLVDGALKRQNLTTYSQYLKKTDEEILVRELEKLGGLVGLILSPQKYTAQVKKLTHDFDFECEQALREMRQNYTALFPYTHMLKQGYEKPNMIFMSDQAMFELARAQLKSLQKK